MPLVTGSGLQNVSDVIDTVRASLVTQGWTTVIDDGTVVANTKEVWMHLPAASTKNGVNMTLGLRVGSSDRLEMALSYLTPSEARLTGVSPRESFRFVLGTPNAQFDNDDLPGSNGAVYPNGATAIGRANEPVRVDKFNQGANYLSHWVFTPNGSPLTSTEQYFICVVEVATGVYRTFGAGEGIKLGGSGWEGGLWLDGSYIGINSGAYTHNFAAFDADYNDFQDGQERSYVLNFNNADFNATSPQAWNPWMHGSPPWSDNWVTCWGMGRRALGRDYLERSPANFSGQAIRVPSRIYAMNGVEQDSSNRMRPLMEIPDVFHMNISAATPGDTILDDTERFLVVPYTSKTGTDNSGNYGFLIRHPDL